MRPERSTLTQIGRWIGRGAKAAEVWVAGWFSRLDQGRQANERPLVRTRGVGSGSVADRRARRAHARRACRRAHARRARGGPVAGALAGAGAQEGALALVEAGAAVLVWDGRRRVRERVHEVVAIERGGETRLGRGGRRGGGGDAGGRVRAQGVRVRVGMGVVRVVGVVLASGRGGC